MANGKHELEQKAVQAVVQKFNSATVFVKVNSLNLKLQYGLKMSILCKVVPLIIIIILLGAWYVREGFK